MSERLSFLPPMPFCPILPPHGNAAEHALHAPIERDLTTPDWIAERKGWRLAAAVKELGYLGWEPIFVLVNYASWCNPIARYSLSAKARQAFYSMREVAHA